MAKKKKILVDDTNTILLSSIVEYFGEFNYDMKEYLEQLQEEDGSINLMDDYFPFKYNSIDDLLDSFDILITVKEEIKDEYSDY